MVAISLLTLIGMATFTSSKLLQWEDLLELIKSKIEVKEHQKVKFLTKPIYTLLPRKLEKNQEEELIYEIKKDLKRKPSPNISYISVTIYSNGRLRRKFRIAYCIKEEKRVAIAGRNIKRGEVLKEEDFYFEDREFYANGHSPYITDKSDIIGKSAKCFIKKDTLITPSKLETSPLIEKGELVDVKFHYKNLVINTKGYALNSAKLGERVKVRTLYSSKFLEGEAIAKGVILIE
jgi:flagella basal body P-ring formation protein FlgA